jgi:hypothetical protein
METSIEYRSDVVTGAYNRLLHRPAEPASLNAGLASLLMNGRAELQAEVAGSPEYLQVRGEGIADGFLNALFQDGVHRSLDPTSRAMLLRGLAQGVSNLQLADAVFSSDEFRGQRVRDIYEGILRREPDVSGLATWVNALKLGLSDEQVLAGLLGSEEYRKRV